MWKKQLVTTGLLVSVALGLSAQADPECLSTQLIDTAGAVIGSATLTETPNGVLVRAQAENLTPGWHAFHLHETGTCTPPDFTSAGGHFNPLGKSHGFASEHGSHAGDLPNVFVGEDGKLDVEFLASQVTLKEGATSLLDENGSALVIHAGVDDYKTDPAGDAGGRVVCGEIRRPD
jgi:Cu-Zn family superoxide dismutase